MLSALLWAGGRQVPYYIGPRERDPSKRRYFKEMDWIDGWNGPENKSSLRIPYIPALPLCDPYDSCSLHAAAANKMPLSLQWRKG